MLESQGYKCAITGVTLTTETVALDHVIPLASGGEDDMSNVQLVHATVNTMKGSLSLAEFVQWCKYIAQNNLGS